MPPGRSWRGRPPPLGAPSTSSPPRSWLSSRQGSGRAASWRSRGAGARGSRSSSPWWPSPGTRRSPAANAAKRAVMRRQAEKRSEYKAKKAAYELELREWKAACQRARKDSEAEPPPPAEPTMERVYADDTTVEALVGILEMNPRGLLDLQGRAHGLDTRPRPVQGRQGQRPAVLALDPYQLPP